MPALRTSTAAKVILMASLVLVPALAAQQPYKLGELKTVGGHEYHDVTVTEKSAEGIAVRHKSGVVRLPWNEVPAETQRLLGHDPQTLTRSAQTARASEPKARIGATSEEFQRAGCAYIGQGSGNLGSTVVNYQRGNYIIQATFWGGRCHELMFMDSAMVEARRSAGLIMDAKELMGSYNEFVKTVLETNAGGAAWHEDKLLTDRARQWTRTDGQVVARYIGGGRVTLTTKAFSDALAADSQHREKKSLEGF